MELLILELIAPRRRDVAFWHFSDLTAWLTMSGREGKADFTGAAVTSALCHPPEVSRFIDHFAGAFLLNKASRLQELKASAVLVIVEP